MKGWMIYSKETLSSKFGNHAFDWMKDSAKAHGLEVDLVFEEDLMAVSSERGLEILHLGRAVNLPDFVVMRSYALEMGRQLEALGVRLFNPTGPLEDAQDKWRTHQLLTLKGIPNPKTVYLARTPVDFDWLMEQLGSPVVVKGLRGSKGEDVYLIDEAADLLPLVDQYGNENLLFQSFVKGADGRDVRVHVIDGKALVAVERIAASGFKSNFHQGGSAQAFTLTEEISELATASAEALSLEIAGVDILLGAEGPTICEVNGIPGFRTVGVTSTVDIPRSIFAYIAKSMVQDQ